MSTVSLVRFTDPLPSLREALRLAGADKVIVSGASVLVKPNLHGGHGHTSAPVVESACLWAREQGAGRVIIADGPFWSCSSEQAREYFRQAGMYAAAEASGAEILNLHEQPYRTIPTDDPALPPEIGLTELLFESDVVMNLPILKTHFNTLVTLGVKNLKGCLRPKDKKAFHERELNTALVGLARIALPRVTVTVLDATTAVEGLGPASGTEVPMGLIAASRDVLAVDSLGCFLAGIDPGEVRIIRDCARVGLGEMDLARIEVLGEDPLPHQRRFRRPNEEVAEQFPKLDIITEGACSACVMNLFEALASIGKERQTVAVPAVAIGGKARIPAGLTVGACTRNVKAGGPDVPGCPPSVTAIREALTSGAG